MVILTDVRLLQMKTTDLPTQEGDEVIDGFKKKKQSFSNLRDRK
jgi:hypothetical protein